MSTTPDFASPTSVQLPEWLYELPLRHDRRVVASMVDSTATPALIKIDTLWLPTGGKPHALMLTPEQRGKVDEVIAASARAHADKLPGATPIRSLRDLYIRAMFLHMPPDWVEEQRLAVIEAVKKAPLAYKPALRRYVASLDAGTAARISRASWIAEAVRESGRRHAVDPDAIIEKLNVLALTSGLVDAVAARCRDEHGLAALTRAVASAVAFINKKGK